MLTMRSYSRDSIDDDMWLEASHTAGKHANAITVETRRSDNISAQFGKSHLCIVIVMLKHAFGMGVLDDWEVRMLQRRSWEVECGEPHVHADLLSRRLTASGCKVCCSSVSKRRS